MKTAADLLRNIGNLVTQDCVRNNSPYVGVTSTDGKLEITCRDDDGVPRTFSLTASEVLPMEGCQVEDGTESSAAPEAAEAAPEASACCGGSCNKAEAEKSAE